MRPLPPACDHPFAKCLAQEEQRLQIDVHDVVPILLRQRDGVGAADDAGIVDQAVDRSVRGPFVAKHGCRAGMIAKVAIDGGEGSACCADLGCRLVHRRAANADHRAAGVRNGHGNALADAGVGTGDHDALAGQAESGQVAHLKSAMATGSTSV